MKDMEWVTYWKLFTISNLSPLTLALIVLFTKGFNAIEFRKEVLLNGGLAYLYQVRKDNFMHT
jgi:hypothetical protein